MFEKEPTLEQRIFALKEEIIRLSVGYHLCKKEELKEALENHLWTFVELWGLTLGGNKKARG